MLPILRLCRVANVFTAMADVLTGFYLAGHQQQFHPFLILGLVSTVGFYLGGMAMNDIIDREIDKVERPNRPIPSGAVDPQTASCIAAVLIVVGCLAALIANPISWETCVALLGCIFLYNWWAKSTFLGPVVMGACRFLNIYLGVCVGLGLNDHFDPDGHNAFQTLLSAPMALSMPRSPLLVALAFGIYIAGITAFSRQEATVSRRVPLVLAMLVINFGLLQLFRFFNAAPDTYNRYQVVIIGLAMSAVFVNRRLFAAISTPSPQAVQLGVKTALMNLLLLHATVLLFIQPSTVLPLIVAAMLVPSMLLARAIAVT